MSGLDYSPRVLEWNGVNVRHLAALKAVVDGGSFGAAGLQLGYTQSAVSQQIAGLEQHVGHELFVRNGGRRSVELTDAGRLLLEHAEVVLGRLHAAEEDLRSLSNGASGRLRIGAFQGVCMRILPKMMPGNSYTWEGLSVELTISSSVSELLVMLERGDIDAAFTVLPCPRGPFEAVELIGDPHGLLVSSDSPLAKREGPIPIEELDSLTLIGDGGDVLIEGHLRSLGLNPRVAFKVEDPQCLQDFVAAGFGSAVVPSLCVNRSDPRVRLLDLTPALPVERNAIAVRRDSAGPEALKSFVERVVAVSRSLEAADAARSESLAGEARGA